MSKMMTLGEWCERHGLDSSNIMVTRIETEGLPTQLHIVVQGRWVATVWDGRQLKLYTPTCIN